MHRGQVRDQRGEHLAGGAADLERALAVATRVLVAVQVQLRHGEVRRGVEVRGELVVGHRVHECRGLFRRCGGLRDRPDEGARQGHHGGWRGAERPVLERARRLPGPDRRLAHPLGVAVEEGVEGQDGHQRHRFAALGVGEPLERRGDAPVRVLEAAEHLLHARAGDREPHAHLDQLLGNERQALEQRRAALLHQAARAQRPSARQQQLDSLPGGRAVGQ